MMRKLSVLISVIFIAIVLTGCWDYKDVDEMTNVVGFAVDKGINKKYRVTYEIADLHEAGNKNGKINSLLVESEGDTLLEASRNAISKNFPKLYYDHTVVVAISQDVAREGVIDVIDFICRDAETRLSIHLFVSEEKTAAEILRLKPLAANLLAVEINNILKEQKYLGKAIPVQTYQFINSISERGFSYIMTAVHAVKNNGEDVLQISGSAVFKGDKLIGFISGDETKTLAFILDEIKGGVIIVEVGSDEKEGRVSLEVIKNKTKIKSSVVDDKIKIQLEIKTVVVLDEHASEEDYSDEEGQKILSKAAKEKLKADIERLIKKAQNEFESDVLGFGRALYRQHPEDWKKYKDDWDKHFKEVEVSIMPTVEIVHTGLLTKSIKIGE